MSSQEISDRGLSLNGSYNYNPPYQTNGNCNPQDSYLTITGNCLNNNTEIYCVILGTTDSNLLNTTTLKSFLTVTGAICEFTAVQTSIDSLLLQWELKLISSPYIQMILVKEGTTTVYSKQLNTLDSKYQYKSKKAFNSCILYNITLMIETTDKTLSDSWSVTENLKGEPLKPRNVVALEQIWKQQYLIRFEVANSLLCNNSIPSTIKLVILNNGDLVTSDAIPWDNLTALPNGLYQTELNVNLTNDTYYYLIVVSQSEYDETFSENPFTISTFDVIDAQYSFINDTDEFCVTCIFANESQALGCIAVLFTTSNIYSMKITRDTSNNTGRDCVTIMDSGLYSISVYDWEGDESDILRNEPAVKNSMFLFRSVAIISITQTTKLTLADTAYSADRMTNIVVSKTAIRTTSITAYSSMITVLQQQDGNNTVMVTVFAVLFGLSMMFLLILVVLVIAILIRQKKTSKSSDGATWRLNDTTAAGGIQMNMAYELHSTNTKSAATGAEDHDYTFNDPVQNERYQTSPAPTNVGNAPIYANVEYIA